MSAKLTRRAVLSSAALTAGSAALLRAGFAPTRAAAQSPAAAPAGVVHSFATGGVGFHTYVSPAEAVHVTAHVVEFEDRLLLVDATMIPPTGADLAALIDGLGKPVDTAILSHEHPDHWSAADALGGVRFATLPEIRDAVVREAAAGGGTAPAAVLDGPDVALGAARIAGVDLEVRRYDDAEAPHTLAVVFPEQRVAIVQDLVYNGVFFAPGVDRGNWIATLEALRDDPAFDTLLVGHGLPTTRGELDVAIAYVRAMDDAMATADGPDEAAAIMRAAYPGYSGAFLLSLMDAYWTR